MSDTVSSSPWFRTDPVKTKPIKYISVMNVGRGCEMSLSTGDRKLKQADDWFQTDSTGNAGFLLICG